MHITMSDTKYNTRTWQ